MIRPALVLLSLALSTVAANAQTPPHVAITSEGSTFNPMQESIEIGASTNEIPITSDFRGADFTLFGALNNIDQLMLEIGQYDVIVTLEGPNEYNTVRKKERIGGLWVNTEAVTFIPLPSSYAIASTRDINLIASESNFKQMGLGVDHLPLRPAITTANLEEVDNFRKAFSRLKIKSGIYQNHETSVRLERTGLFWATLRLPANVPNGVHTAKAYLFKSGNPIAQRELKLRVVKTGMEQAISNAAHQSPITYGFLCVLLAVVTGLSASMIFRKD